MESSEEAMVVVVRDVTTDGKETATSNFFGVGFFLKKNKSEAHNASIIYSIILTKKKKNKQVTQKRQTSFFSFFGEEKLRGNTVMGFNFPINANQNKQKKRCQKSSSGKETNNHGACSGQHLFLAL